MTIGLITYKNNMDEEEKYSIKIDSVSQFRYELMKMIEKVRYDLDGYDKLTSSEIAEKFERKINSNKNKSYNNENNKTRRN